MTSEQPIKSASNAFKSTPFYLIQSNGPDKRFVAYFENKQNIRSFLLSFVNNAVDKLQIKIRDFDNPDNPRDFEGDVSKQQLRSVLDKYEELIFHDGYHDLMIRLPETGDYVAFDEHGLVFIYTDADYSDILKTCGLTHQPDQKLVYQYEHWHYRPKNAREDLKSLIKELGLHL
jgi:hypothetical protein